MGDGTVRVDHHGHVAVITLDRPARRNALTETTWAALDAAVASIEGRLPRAVVITGAGDRAFSAGMDVNPDNPQNAAMARAIGEGDVALVETLLGRLRAVFDRLVALPVPVIAAVNGLAFGGGAELAARCDLRVADPAAIFCFSEVRLGLMPDLGGGVALARLLGPSRAADLILTARRVDAAEALSLGLLNRISAPGCVVAMAVELGATIAKNGPRAVRSSLEILRRSADLPMAEALALELSRAATLITTGECAAGIQAFLLKTEPEFSDP